MIETEMGSEWTGGVRTNSKAVFTGTIQSASLDRPEMLRIITGESFAGSISLRLKLLLDP
jgi:hypothetical protein